MMCPFCGSDSKVKLSLPHPLELSTELHRTCSRGHNFLTYEVHPTQLADLREMRCAVRNIRRRISHWHRDEAIRRDKRPIRQIADEYNLTDARVRQIRAAMREREPSREPRK